MKALENSFWCVHNGCKVCKLYTEGTQVSQTSEEAVPRGPTARPALRCFLPWILERRSERQSYDRDMKGE